MTDPHVTPPDTRPALEQLAAFLGGDHLSTSPGGLLRVSPNGSIQLSPQGEAWLCRIFALRAQELAEADAKAAHEHHWQIFEAAPSGPHHRLILSCSCGAREDLPPGCPCGANHDQAGSRFL